MSSASDVTSADLRPIQQYVWTRYVDYGTPEEPLDEAQALATLEAHYEVQPLAGDADCFYFGILAFERSFAEPARRDELLERALEAFTAYRSQARDGAGWPAVQDRYEEALELLGRGTA